MNAVEIEEAVSELAAYPFDRAEFPYVFLTAFGNKDTTIKRLRSGNTNASDVPGGVLQRNHIHIAVCDDGMVSKTMVMLRESPKTSAAKAKFILATDGVSLEAEDLISGEPIACVYADFAKHFGFFLPLAGISTVKEIKDNPFDIKATGKLNKLYVELLRDNPEWAKDAKRPALNQFIARLIFCFFAEDTGIFLPKQFTKIVEQMSDGQSGNTHEILYELFRAMDLKSEDRETAKIKNWANGFPYVNGGMFAGSAECPKFSKIARSYLLNVGNLEWDKINPDIFGSMIQAVADDDERGDLGMHYTSVPNILKVLNPLFLDDLREHLKTADNNSRKLRNLRKRLATIRVFDPACGSGNFLVIAYKEMRAIEHEIVRRTGDAPKSWIKLDNFYGIEIKSFAVEIARLALLIAEFQCDVQYISQQQARAMVLPLHRTGQIRAGNSLELSWLELCPPVSKTVAVEHDLAGPTGRLALTENAIADDVEPELYICGNPPYVGDKKQSDEQKKDLQRIFSDLTDRWRSLDYITGFFYKAAEQIEQQGASAAFVSTNSICQGQQVDVLWSLMISKSEIISAHTAFKWSNLAQHNAGVTVIIVQLGPIGDKRTKVLFQDGLAKVVDYISPYLTSQKVTAVRNHSIPISDLPKMTNGCAAKDGGNLLLENLNEIPAEDRFARSVAKPFYGSDEIISGKSRFCLWITDEMVDRAMESPFLSNRIEGVRAERLKSKKEATRSWAKHPYRFVEIRRPESCSVIGLPSVATENRPYLTPELLTGEVVISNLAFAMYDAPIWAFALLSSRLHLVWVSTVCGQLETRIRYSNTLGWNSFPVPKLTEQNRDTLAAHAQDILIARESQFPENIAKLYDAENMPEELRRAHESNDEAIERIYIGRRFRNDTERLEKLFELYAKMTAEKPITKKAKRVA